MDKINEFLTRGVENIIPGKNELGSILRLGKPLNIYNGIDATASKIHLGHAVPLKKLQKLVDLGHHVTFLIGDFTAFIGDTSDKDNERPQLSEEQINQNWQTYKKQAEKILDFSKIQIVHNSEWLDKLSFRDIIKIARNFSLNEFLSRELIKKRLTSGDSVNLAELIYPIAQGYDSYHLKTDLQIGGTEQIFNIQAGRTLIKEYDHRESFILTLQTLEGTDGRKMSKSWGNAIWIDDAPSEMYGKVMSLKDELIIQYFTLATNISTEDILEIENRLKQGDNPLNLKKELAFRIVSELNDSKSAQNAQEEFERVVQNNEIPEEISELEIEDGINIIELLVVSKLAESRSGAKRLIEQGAVEVDGEKIETTNFTIENPNGKILKVGKRNFLRLKTK